jgi:hypothetical protein
VVILGVQVVVVHQVAAAAEVAAEAGKDSF